MYYPRKVSLSFIPVFFFSFLIFQSLFVIHHSSVVAAVPRLITYQGKLTSIDGVGINDTVDIHFLIFADSISPSSIWDENHLDVPVRKGLFDLVLGSITPLDLVFDTGYWLEIEVDGDRLLPRMKFTSAPYALRAGLADSIIGGAVGGSGTENFIPIWNAAGDLGSSIIFQSPGGRVGIGTPSPAYLLQVENTEFQRAIYAKNTRDASTNYAIYAYCEANQNSQYGIYSKSKIDTIYDYNAYGVYGIADADDAAGDSADAYGGYFRADADDEAYGVYGYATTDLNKAYGVYGYGYNTENNVDVFGVYGYVYDSGDTSNSYGVYGRSRSSGINTPAYGLYGDAYCSGDGSPAYGVYGKGDCSTTGSGVYGVYGYADGFTCPIAYGVYGFAEDADTNWAGYFQGNVNITGDLTVLGSSPVDNDWIVDGVNMHSAVGGSIGIGTTTPVCDLHLVGGDTLTQLMVAPNRSLNGGNSHLFLAEDNDGTYGMFFRFDGDANNLQLYGKSSGTIYGPHLTVGRNDGVVGIAGNTGIGTSTPGDHKLFVSSNASGGYWNYSTVRIENEATTGEGVALILETNSTDGFALGISALNGGQFIRCDSYLGGWHPVFQVDSLGKTTCAILKITGGSDIAEPFEVPEKSEIEPGMILSIDPQNPGKLKLCEVAYDKKVAGIVSGAGGVNPGMVMGQEGTIADGEHPVALSGRVYAYATNSNGTIEPGDLLTTSDIPGHAMKVEDYDQAYGAVIGKAMSKLDEETGLVLVLVSLQ
ncbi:hypothetical protein JXI42_02975 [bacterium]|nr:hypothetical protein [bacterium]